VSRKTLERVEAVKRKDPLLAKRMIDGKLSVSSAYRKVKVEELRKHAAAEVSADDTLVTDLQAVLGKYRTVYLDPPWRYEDSGVRGAAEGHYPTMSVKELVALPVPKLAHNDGAHFWVWTTWPLLREATPHDLLRAWGLRWVGEILWDKETLGTGHYTRSRTEVLILAVKGALPLLSDCVNPLVNVKRGMHSEKPAEFAKLISDLSPGPRIELFARRAREGWDRWGLEA
jgi:N6-adenosine-specific RNA methylase IME4